MSEERRFDQAEVARIVKRVAQLQDAAGPDHNDAHALTQGELEQVVGELGMPTSLVARAASELALPPQRGKIHALLGGKTELLFETHVVHEIGEAAYEEMLEALRRALGDPGELREQGRARIWETSSRTSRNITLTLVRGEGGTRIRLEERMPVDARTTVGVSTGGGAFAGVMSAVPLKVLMGKSAMLLTLPFVIGAGAALGLMVGRSIWKRVSQGREDELHIAWREILAAADRHDEAGQRALTAGGG